MANDPISPKTSFERAAAQVRAKRTEPKEKTAGARTSAQRRAELNEWPDDATLHSLVEKGLAALSRGVRWARGSILNLLV